MSWFHRIHRRTHTYTDVHRHTQTYTDIHRRTQTYTDIHRRTQTYTGIHRRTHEYIYHVDNVLITKQLSMNFNLYTFIYVVISFYLVFLLNESQSNV